MYSDIDGMLRRDFFKYGFTSIFPHKRPFKYLIHIYTLDYSAASRAARWLESWEGDVLRKCFHSTACYQISYPEIPQWRAYRERKSKTIFIFHVTINLLCGRMVWLYRIPRTPRYIKLILKACRFNYFCQSGVAYRSTYAGCCPPAGAYLSIHTHYYDGRWHITWPTWLNTIVSYIFLSLGDDKSIKQYPVLLLFYNDELI